MEGNKKQGQLAPEPSGKPELLVDRLDGSVIRTMAKDLARAEGKTVVHSKPIASGIRPVPVPPKVAEPPKGLPIVEEPLAKPTDILIPKPFKQEVKSELEKLAKEAESAKPKTDKQKSEKPSAPSKPALAGRPLKYTFVTMAIIILLGSAGGFFYWWNYIRVVEPPAPVTHLECYENQCVTVEGEGDNSCLTNNECQPTPEPKALLRADQTYAIELGIDEKLDEKIKSILAIKQDKVFRLLLKREDGYLTLQEVITGLNLSFPSSISASFADANSVDSYNIYIYGQGNGNRLGLVIKMGQSDSLVSDLKNWELSMVDDLKPLLLTANVPAAFTEEFQDNVHNEIAVRYLNFPDPNFALDYGLVKGNLLIATSRESMYQGIEAIQNYVSEEDESKIDSLGLDSLGELNVEVMDADACNKGSDTFYANGQQLRLEGRGFAPNVSIQGRVNLLLEGEGQDKEDGEYGEYQISGLQASADGELDETIVLSNSINSLGLARIEIYGEEGPNGVQRILSAILAVWPSATSDADKDGIPDICDLCPETFSDDQTDSDMDGMPDVCDPFPNDLNNDLDGDGLAAEHDPCPFDRLNDADGDDICAPDDNCPDVINYDQADGDFDGVGDACDE